MSQYTAHHRRPSPHVFCCDECYAARFENERLREALREIRDQDWTENALDPQWSARIAALALTLRTKGAPDA